MPDAIPVENRPERNSPRSIMGSRSRRSHHTNRASSTAAAANSPAINAEPQPTSAPKEMADRSAAMAGKKRASPVQSKPTRACRFCERGTSRMAATAPNTPKGTLTKKISRHPLAASSSPPTVGPKARPSA